MKRLNKLYWLSLPVAVLLAVIGYHVARPVLYVAGWYLVLFNPICLWVYMLVIGITGSYLILVGNILLAIPGVPKLRDRIKAYLHERTKP
jgi:vacuolar-type H+-ATPase subunit I/STV1